MNYTHISSDGVQIGQGPENIFNTTLSILYKHLSSAIINKQKYFLTALANCYICNPKKGIFFTAGEVPERPKGSVC